LSYLISLPYQVSYRSFPRSGYQEAIGTLLNSIHPGEVIIHDNKLSFFPIHYYYPSADQVFLGDEPGAPNDTYALTSQKAMQIFPAESLDAATAGREWVALVVFEKTVEEYRSKKGAEHPVIGSLLQSYNEVEQIRVGDLKILRLRKQTP